MRHSRAIFPRGITVPVMSMFLTKVRGSLSVMRTKAFAKAI